MLPAHFSLTVISLTFTEYTGHTHSHGYTKTHRWLSSLPTNFTSDRFPEDISWCDWLPLIPWDDTQPGDFLFVTIPTHQCHYSSTCIQSCTCFSPSHFFCWNGLFLMFHSMACAFFLLFLRIWMSMPHWKKTKQIKTENMFPNCGGWGLRGEHNINQGCWVRNTARGSSRHPTSS